MIPRVARMCVGAARGVALQCLVVPSGHLLGGGGTALKARKSKQQPTLIKGNNVHVHGRFVGSLRQALVLSNSSLVLSNSSLVLSYSFTGTAQLFIGTVPLFHWYCPTLHWYCPTLHWYCPTLSLVLSNSQSLRQVWRLSLWPLSDPQPCKCILPGSTKF